MTIDAEVGLFAWAWKARMGLLEKLAHELHADVAAGDTVIATIAEKLAYRTPGLNKPMGHIVLKRDEAERLVQAWRALFGSR